MKIWNSIESFEPVKNAVVTIGTFDGMHLGHRVITSRINAIAAGCGGHSVVITFTPHPRLVLHPDDPKVKLLTTDQEKQHLMERAGVDHLIMHPFTIAFSQLTSDSFVRDYLVRHLQAKFLVIGYDHHFGKDREGSWNDLVKLAPELGYEVEQIPEQDVDNMAVSSTKIRNALALGDVTVANGLLGYPYRITGSVVEGDKLGRTMGFPTANLETQDSKLIPADGVYAVRVECEGRQLQGMLYIGNRPTLNGKRQSIEVNIFDFNSNIYRQKVVLQLIARIRPDKPFANLKELESQLVLDKTEVLTRLNNIE